MYKVFADGELMYTPALSDDGYALITPTVTKEVNKAGSMSFIMAEDHPFYDRLKKLKTIITVYNDGKEVFRGRVMSAETDFYKRKNVYCEGELAFLNDSIVKAYQFKGTAAGMFRKLIEQHNESVEEYAQFAIGTVDVQGKADVDEITYTNTFRQIENMINAFGGYLYVREEDGKRVIDYLQDAESTIGQKIEFGVNMLDLTEKITAEDVYTVVLPVGASKNNSYVNIKSVNNGKDYIQNTAAVNQFGRIWRVFNSADEDDPEQLLKDAKTFLKKGIEAAVTMTINAVDLHLMNVDTDQFDTGCMVRVVSYSHGIDADYLCSEIVFDIVNPQNNRYTFGIPKTDASGVMATAKEKAEQAHRGGGGTKKKLDDEIKVIEEYGSALTYNKELIKMMIWSDKKLGDVTSHKEADFDMTAEQILAEVSQIDVDDITNVTTRMKSSIKQNANEIISRVEKNGVISAINQTAEKITIQAKRIDLDGYVTASQLDSKFAHISGTCQIDDLHAFALAINSSGSFSFKGNTIGIKNITINGTAYHLLGTV